MPTPLIKYKNFNIHFPQKRIIWSNDPKYKGFIIRLVDVLHRCPEGANDFELYKQTETEMLADKLNYIREHATRPEGKIICIGIVSTASGRFMGIKEFHNNDTGLCFTIDDSKDTDETTWGLDVYDNLICIDKHDSKTNYLIYRALKSHLSERQIKSFTDKIKNGTLTNYDLSVYTESMGKYIENL